MGLSRQKLRAAFADMHRELYDLWTVGETVIVRLALQGTHTAPPLGRPARADGSGSGTHVGPGPQAALPPAAAIPADCAREA